MMRSKILALYLNVLVAVVQAFLKIPALKGLAPTQKEPPFLFAQLVVLLIFIGLAVFSVKRFHSQPNLAS
jgi:flagellar biogenesis protein FliO